MSSPAFQGRPPQREEGAAAQGSAAQGATAQRAGSQATLQPPQTELQLQTLWRARALRYVLIYVLLACVLVTLRYQSREVYPNLHRLGDTRTELQRQQGELSLTVQTLTSEQRIRAWALANGMVPYAQASKQTQSFGANTVQVLPSTAQPSPARLTVRTVWR